MSGPSQLSRRRAALCLFLTCLCACGGAAGEAGSEPAEPPPPPVELAFDPANAPAEIAACELEPGESLDVVEVRDESGTLVLRREVLRDADGMLNHGHFQRWHANGQMAEDGWYLRGAKHGTYAVIADSGLKQTETTYRSGVKQGLALTWGDLGVLKTRALFADGVLEGPYETFTANGPRSRGAYHAGVEQGPWTFWLPDGSKQSEGSFERGKKQGSWTFWHPNGELKSKEEYVAGVLEGHVVEYDEAGHVSAERNYLAGAPDGLSIEYYPDGSERARITYRAGVQHGPQSRWYEGGVLQMQGEMVEGQRQGSWVYNQADGSRNEAWSGTYEADVRVGD